LRWKGASFKLWEQGGSMRSMKWKTIRGSGGQSLIEAGLLLPVLLLVTFNAVNLGYVFFSYLNMATASRQGAEYSIQGAQTISESNLPTADSVKSLVSEDITTAVPGGSNAPIRVCTESLGLNTNYTGVNTVPNCNTYPSGSSFPSTDSNCTGGPNICPDPEAAYGLILNRIDVSYQVTPLIDGTAFNLIFPQGLTFHRYLYMRAIN
jgi:Flp pilus assembly protein TadG